MSLSGPKRTVQRRQVRVQGNDRGEARRLAVVVQTSVVIGQRGPCRLFNAAGQGLFGMVVRNLVKDAGDPPQPPAKPVPAQAIGVRKKECNIFKYALFVVL